MISGGETAGLIAAHTWSATPLGSPERWPQPLTTLVDVMLASAQPMFLAWGADRTLLYNAAYAAILAEKHPSALGRDFLEVWSEIRNDLIPIVSQAYAGQSVQMDDIRLIMQRRGYPEETHFAFSYTPVRDEKGRIGGFFCACVETTDQVLARRAQAFRLALEENLRDLVDPELVMAAAITMLGEHLGAERVGYGQVQADEAIIRLSHCYARGLEPIFGDFPLDSFGPKRIARQRRGETEVCADVRADPDQDDATWASIGTRAFVSVPLVREGRLRATLYVNAREPRRWSLHEIALIEDVAARTWSANERVRAEAATRQSEAQFRLMADAVPQIVWITDSEGRAEFFNEQWSAYTGCNYAPTTAAQVAADHVHPDDAAATVAAFDEARRTGTTFFVEHRIRSASGDYRWFLVRGEPYRDPATGEVVRWFGASVDVHDRKLAEERLRELNATLERRVETAIAERDRTWNNARDLLVVISTDGVFSAVNPAWTSVLGWRQDELVGRSYLDFIHPDDHPSSRGALSNAAQDTLPVYENRYRSRDGTYRWISWVAAPEGELIYANGRDVTAEKTRQAELDATEAARREADALYRAYFENTAEALFVVRVLEDGGFTVEDLNPAHQASIGLLLAEVRNKRIDEILPHDVAATVVDHYRRAMVAAGVYQYRESFELDGRTTYWDTVLVPVRDTDGRIVRLIGSSRDLTAQVAAEEQLRQSQKLESMGQLTGGVAHDFNNLLTPIIGSLDLLIRRGIGNERERRLIDGALQSAERAKTLVQRLLAFARRQPLQPVAVDLRSVVEGMTGLIGSTLGPSIDVQVELQGDLPPATADLNQLEMALLNLAVNARDAMPDGGVLRIAARRRSVQSGEATLRPGDYVLLCVSDSGVGMDEITLNRAIEPFFSTKGVGRGTGLGLSMVHGLAAQLGGALKIESTPGQGTTVELWLPASAIPVGDADAAASEPNAIRGRGIALLVDDEDLVRMSTADMLIDLGFEVREAASADEALRFIAEGGALDLLVTDHLMPGMSGADLARHLRTSHPSLPVLIVSGYAEAEGIAADLPRLTKPFRNADLAASLSALDAVQ